MSDHSIYRARIPARGNTHRVRGVDYHISEWGDPAVSFEFTGDEPIITLAGDTGNRFSRYEINAWAKEYSVAVDLKIAIEIALSSHVRESCDPDHEEEIGLYHFISEYRFYN